MVLRARNLALAILAFAPSIVAAPGDDIARARNLFEHGKFEEAEEIAKAKGVDAIPLRAEILRAKGKPDEAVRLLETRKSASGVEGRRVRLLLGELLIATGRRKDAEEPLMKIIEEYNDRSIASSDAEGLAMVGRAASLLRSPKDANNAYNESERVDKKRLQTLLYRADLFLDKYDPGHAEELLREALEIDGERSDTLVALARVKLEQNVDFESAEELLDQAIKSNPKNADVFAVQAGIALRDSNLKKAEESIAKGLAINSSHLELLSLKAAARFLADDRAGFESAKKAVFAKNKEYATFYTIVSEFAEWEHRYDDIVNMMKEATQLDPDDGKSWATLGLTQLRSLDEAGGLQSLQRAWSKDHFNVRVFNTLNLYEQAIPNQYETVNEGVFAVRYAKDERKVLERYVPKLLGEAWASMKARYGYVPKLPVGVELYGTREQFSVRTSGLPNIGIQGVCFGQVVAAMSPKSEPFNWGNVLWHELGHVFAIQMSNNHVPRWFTEGLSEYETIVRRPEWQRELDRELYIGLTQNTLPSAVEMNRAFTHAKDSEDVTTAYYASSQMVVFTVERFGMPKVVDALKRWGAGAQTSDVIQKSFGLSPDAYDAAFKSWALSRLSRYKGQFLFQPRSVPLAAAKLAAEAQPASAPAQVDLALSLLRSKKAKEAKQALDKALSIDPKDARALFVAAKLALGEKDGASAEGHLAKMIGSGADGVQVRLALADAAELRKNSKAQKSAFEAAHRFDPSNPEPLKGLFDLALEEKDDDGALKTLRELAPLEEHDKRVWRMLLERLVQRKEWAEAVKVGESALFVDVHSAPVHLGYARALIGVGRFGAAQFEAESALLCKSTKKEEASAHAIVARAFIELKNPAKAREHIQEAKTIDPENADIAGRPPL